MKKPVWNMDFKLENMKDISSIYCLFFSFLSLFKILKNVCFPQYLSISSRGLLEIVMGNTNIWKLTDSCRMVDCDEETSMEYGFQIGKYEGYYVLSFEEKFVYEKLYYFTGKQRGTLFEIKFDKGKIAIKFLAPLFPFFKSKTTFLNDIKFFNFICVNTFATSDFILSLFIIYVNNMRKN